MSWTCEEVLAKLGDEAQITARGIVMIVDAVAQDGGPIKKHLLVAEFRGDTFWLTDEGKAFLEPNIVDAEVVSEKRKTRAPKKEKVVAPKKEKVVEDSNEILDDLDLIE